MYIVTGGAGFIGSNLVHELNRYGIADILIVDNLADSRKLVNLHGARFVDYMDKREFRRALAAKALGVPRVEAIFHQGACSNTLVDDGVYMMDNNFTCSKEILGYAIEQGAPLVYASTAAVYGLSGPGHFTPTLENERPLNIYGFSKLAFDHHFAGASRKDRCPSPWWGCVTSTSTAHAKPIKDAWLPSSTTFRSRSSIQEKCSCSRGQAATATGSSAAISFLSAIWRS